MHRSGLILLVGAAAGILGVLGFRLGHYGFFSVGMFDDAYFFTRYADIFLDTGVFGWNRGEGPLYGNTSQTFQLLVTAIYALTGRNVVLSLQLGSALGLLAYVSAAALCALTLMRAIGSRRGFVVCAIAIALIAVDQQVYLLQAIGMETLWAMALVALSLALAQRLGSAPDARGAWLGGGVAAICYVTRPDAAVLALAPFAGLIVFGGTRELRRAGALAALAGLALVGFFVGLCWIYFGDPLPLAFQAKTAWLSTLPTDGSPETVGLPRDFFLQTLDWHLPEVVLAAAALFRVRRLPAALRGAIVGAAAFCLYHGFLVVPVMGFFGRFVAPAVPILAALALVSVDGILATICQMTRRAHYDGGAAALGAGLVLLFAVKALPTAVLVYSGLKPALAAPPGLNTAEAALARAADDFYFFRGHMTALVGALDRGCTVASTENGILSALAVKNRLIDLSGLHDPVLVRQGFSADRLLLEQRPDILAFPHAWYGEWVKALRAHPALAAYEVRPAVSPAGMPIAFRRDSDCARRAMAALYGK